jgi:hypothetical protein
LLKKSRVQEPGLHNRVTNWMNEAQLLGNLTRWIEEPF